MSDLTEVLGLDETAVRSQADAYEGFGKVLSSPPILAAEVVHSDETRWISRFIGEGNKRPWIASCFAFSALLRSLLRDERASDLFLLAAKAWPGDAYARILAVCAGVTHIRDVDRDAERQTIVADDLFADLLEWSAEGDRSRDFIDQAADYGVDRNAPVGRLGLQFEVYRNAIRESDNWTQDHPSTEAVEWLLRRAYEAVLGMRSDSFHWRSLLGTAVPVEPEIIAACMPLARNWRRLNRSPGTFTEESLLTAAETVPFEIAIQVESRRTLRIQHL